MNKFGNAARTSSQFIRLFGWIIFAAGIIITFYQISQTRNFHLDYGAIGTGLVLVAIGYLVEIQVIKLGISSADLNEPKDVISGTPAVINISPTLKESLESLFLFINQEKEKKKADGIEEINALLKNIVPDKASFKTANAAYQQLYDKPIIKHLVSISSNYIQISRYVDHLINLGVCSKEYPHEILG